jgi:hypothetical protein
VFFPFFALSEYPILDFNDQQEGGDFKSYFMKNPHVTGSSANDFRDSR